MQRMGGIIALAALLTTCNKPAPSGSPTDAALSGVASPPEGSSDTPVSELSEERLTWQEAVRLGFWRQAAALIDALPEAERQEPSLRFVRAAVALRLDEPERAIELLQPLPGALPLLESESRALLIEALAAAGHDLEAATLLSQKDEPAALIRAAHSYRRAGHPAKAQATLARALRGLTRLRGRERQQTETSARALRARLALESKDVKAAARDLHWLAVENPTHHEAKDAADTLNTLGKQFRLSPRERYSRAQAFADAGRVEATKFELEQVGDGAIPALNSAERSFLLGWAWYTSRRDYDEAVRHLRAASAQGGTKGLRSRFYVARALARAQRDDEAIEHLDRLMRDAPGSAWAEQALYLKARLYYTLARWELASETYSTYLKRYGTAGDRGKLARYSRAVADLAGSRFEAAEGAFTDLVAREKDLVRRERYRQLLGVALEGRGKETEAKQTYESVIRNRPLSFPAAAAAVRLSLLGVEPPRPLAPAAESATNEAAAPPLEVILPGKAGLLASLGLDGEAEAALIGEERALRAAHAPRSSEALCRAYAQLWTAARRYRIGQQTVGWRPYDAAISAKNRWLWECNYPTPYAPIVRRAEARHQLPKGLIYAVMRQESAFRPRVSSPVGAVGLMQLMPSTALNVAAELGVQHSAERLEEPAHNIELGAAYLAKLLGFFDGCIALAVPAYNAGPRAVSHWLQGAEELPVDVFVARIPYSETRHYTYRVLENHARYQYLHSGGLEPRKLDLALPRGARAPADAY